jgi:hypothetical protein
MLSTQTDCDLLQHRPVLPSGKTPHDNNTTTVLTIAKIWSWVPKGLNAKADWLTDLTVWPTISRKVTLTLID